MKKSLWLLLVVAALIAVFAVAGCLQGTTPEEPTEPEEPTTPTPTDYCPTSTTTTLQKLYDNEDGTYFKLYITFDQPVFIQDLACYQDTNNWKVSVSRYVPFQYYANNAWNSAVYKPTLTAAVSSVTFQSDKTFVVEFTVSDDGARAGGTAIAGAGEGSVAPEGPYTGLICSEADYNAFIAAFDDGGDIAPATGDKYADVVSWTFTGTASCGVVYDAQGNPCVDPCELSGSLCCEVTYCEECVEVPNCPIGEGTCL